MMEFFFFLILKMKTILLFVLLINLDKNNNKFILNVSLNCHKSRINKVVYSLFDNKIISCSVDKTIKFLEKNNHINYQFISILTHYDSIESILLLEKKNLLVSSGLDGTKYLNYIKYFNKVKCSKNNNLDIIDNEKIFVGGNYEHLMKVISISEK